MVRKRTPRLGDDEHPGDLSVDELLARAVELQAEGASGKRERRNVVVTVAGLFVASAIAAVAIVETVT